MENIYDELKGRSEEIKNENRAGKNTAVRIGSLFSDLVDNLKNLQENAAFIPLSGTLPDKPVTGDITLNSNIRLKSPNGAADLHLTETGATTANAILLSRMQSGALNFLRVSNTDINFTVNGATKLLIGQNNIDSNSHLRMVMKDVIFDAGSGIKSATYSSQVIFESSHIRASAHGRVDIESNTGDVGLYANNKIDFRVAVSNPKLSITPNIINANADIMMNGADILFDGSKGIKSADYNSGVRFEYDSIYLYGEYNSVITATHMYVEADYNLNINAYHDASIYAENNAILLADHNVSITAANSIDITAGNNAYIQINYNAYINANHNVNISAINNANITANHDAYINVGRNASITAGGKLDIYGDSGFSINTDSVEIVDAGPGYFMLRDTNGANSVDVKNRILYSEGGSPVLNYNGEYALPDVINVFQGTLYYSDSLYGKNSTIEFIDGFELSSNGYNLNITEGRYEYLGNTLANFQQGYLNDESYQESVNYGSRLLKNSIGSTIIDFEYCNLNDYMGMRSVNYHNRLLYSSTGKITIDFDTCMLKSLFSESVILQWGEDYLWAQGDIDFNSDSFTVKTKAGNTLFKVNAITGIHVNAQPWTTDKGFQGIYVRNSEGNMNQMSIAQLKELLGI